MEGADKAAFARGCYLERGGGGGCCCSCTLLLLLLRHSALAHLDFSLSRQEDARCHFAREHARGAPAT